MNNEPKFKLGQRVVVKFIGEIEGETTSVFKNMRITGIMYEDQPGANYDTIRKFYYKVTTSGRWISEDLIEWVCADQ